LSSSSVEEAPAEELSVEGELSESSMDTVGVIDGVGSEVVPAQRGKREANINIKSPTLPVLKRMIHPLEKNSFVRSPKLLETIGDGKGAPREILSVGSRGSHEAACQFAIEGSSGLVFLAALNRNVQDKSLENSEVQGKGEGSGLVGLINGFF
jgi:hypothetical protein